MGANEYYREKISGSLDLERETLHISDDTGRIALVDTKTYDGGNNQFLHFTKNDETTFNKVCKTIGKI